MASVTVPGPGGSAVSLPGGTGPGISVLTSLVGDLNPTTTTVTAWSGGATPTPTPGVGVNEFLVTGAGGFATSVPGGYDLSSTPARRRTLWPERTW